MNTASISLNFENMIANSQLLNLHLKNASNTVLRMVLINNELLRIPHYSEWCLQVHSGKAWVSYGGEDYYLQCGESMRIPKVKHGAIISPIGKETLFFELNRQTINRNRVSISRFLFKTIST